MPDQPKNGAVRVSTCRKCGVRVRAGARGPVPKLCPDCRGAPDRQLLHTLRSAARLAGALPELESLVLKVEELESIIAARHPDRFPGE